MNLSENEDLLNKNVNVADEYDDCEDYEDIILEEMSDFFTARLDGYDEHMIYDVPGCKDGYEKMAELVPSEATNLLDLGCGTGLELDEIYKTHPDIKVTGVDMTKAMLEKIKEKHPDKDVTLVNQSYLDYDFGNGKFDIVVSFQTMHHLSHAEKEKLYKKIYDSLSKNGMYIECDYMVEDQEEEDFYYEEIARLRKEQNLKPEEFYHYDTPCTIENQVKMFRNAGFTSVEKVWRMENTTMIISKK